MATQIGTVSILIGTATATAADGTVRNLQLGDKIYADELISTGPGAAVEIEFADGTVMDLGRNSQLVLDNAVYDPNTVAEVEPTADADAIQQAILAGVDPTELTEATAAGAGAGTGGNEGSEFVTVDYLAPEVTPESGFETTGISIEFDEVDVEVPGPEDDIPTLSINDVTVLEPDGGGIFGGGGSGNYNIVYVIDVSGSMNSGTRMADTKQAIISLNQQIIDAGVASTTQVAIIPFNSGIPGGNRAPTFYSTADIDANNDSTNDIEAYINGLYASGGTNFTPPLEVAENWLQADDGGSPRYEDSQNIVFFISDGVGSFNSSDPDIQALYDTSTIDAEIIAIGISSGASLTTLDIVDDLDGSNDSAIQVLNTSDLESVLTDLVQGESGGEDGETSTGSTIAEFTVTLSSASTVDVMVDFVTADGTAISGGSGVAENDYGSTSGTVIIPAGSTTATIEVTIFGDNVTEITEQYFVTLSAPVNATIADDTGIGTILDNDLVEFSIEALSGSEVPDHSYVDEGEDASYTISYDGTLADGVQASVTFDTASGTVVNFDAIEGVDFDESTGTLVFTGGSGVTSVTVFVQTTEDLLIEHDEDYSINLISSSANSTINPSADHVDTTILDDDFPVVSIEPDTQNNGDIVEEGNALSYVVSLSAPGTSNAVVDLSFTGGTADDSGEDQDYTPTFYSDSGLTNVITSLTFTPGETAKTVYVNTLDNDPPLNEVNETVNVTVTASSGVTGTDEAVGTITDSDLPTINIADGGTVEEGNVLSYVVSLSAASDTAVSANLAFTGGSASGGSDYTTKFYSDAGLTTEITSVSFAAGETATTVYIGTLDNDPPFAEANETVDVSLNTIVGATAGDTTGVGTITDQDQLITFAINVTSEEASDDTVTQQATVTEENDLDDVATFTILLTGVPLYSGNSATVDVNFTGTSVDADFVTAALASLSAVVGSTTGVSLSGNTLTFDNSFVGSSLSFAVEVVDDGDDEGPEDLVATLSGESVLNGSAELVTGQEAATVDIIDDDAEFPAGLAYSIAGGFNAGNDQIDEVRDNDNGSTKYLYGVDLEDGTTTQIGQISTSNTVIGMSLNPDDGMLYALSADGIYKIDPATAESILIIDDDLSLFGQSNPAGAAFDTSGTYYIAANNEVLTVSNIESVSAGTDLSTLTSPLFTLSNSTKIHGIAAYTAGLVYYITESGGNSILNVYDESDTSHNALGTITDGVDTPDINGISFDNFGNLWGVDNQGDLVRISTDNGEVLGVVTQNNSQVTAAGFFSIAIDVDDPLFTGTSDDDILGSSPGPDTIDGLGGDDVVYGNGDDDILSGGSGDDLIVAGSGNDTLSDGTGSDILSGGDGNDLFIMSNDSDVDVIGDFDATADSDTDQSTSEGGDDVGSGIDTLDLSDLLTGLGVDGSNQDMFIELSDTGNSVEVRVDSSGTGTFSGDAEVVLQNFNTLNPTSTTSIQVSVDATNLNVDIS